MKSTIKYLLISILTTALLPGFSSNTFAQQGKGQDKDKSEKKEKQEHAKQDQGKPDKAPKDAGQDALRGESSRLPAVERTVVYNMTKNGV